MMLPRAVRQLQAALALYERPAKTREEGNAARSISEGFTDFAGEVTLEPGRNGDASRLAARHVQLAGDKLARLEAQLRQAPAAGRTLLASQAIQLQLYGACAIIHGCVILAQALDVGPVAVQHLAASAALVVRTGQKALAAALGGSDPLLACALARMQAAAMASLVQLLVVIYPNATAAHQDFERQHAKPAEFRTWMSTLSDALLNTIGTPQAECIHSQTIVLRCYMVVCNMVLPKKQSACLLTLRTAVQSDTDLCRKALKVLLRLAVPAIGHGLGILPAPPIQAGQGAGPSAVSCGCASPAAGTAGSNGGGGKADEIDAELWPALGGALHVLNSSCLRAALAQHMHSEEGPATLALAFQLLKAWPISCQPGMPAHLHWACHSALGSVLCYGREALAVCECCRARSGAISDADVRKGAWTIVELFPKAAATIRAAAALAEVGRVQAQGQGQHAEVAAAGQVPDPQLMEEVVEVLCNNWAYSFQLLNTAVAREVRSMEEAEACFAAMDSGMRLLPLLAQLQLTHYGVASSSGGHRQGQGQDEAYSSVAVQGHRIPAEQSYTGLADVIVTTLVGHLGYSACTLVESRLHGLGDISLPDASAFLGLSPTLRQLHATSVRLAHWAAADGGRGLAVLPVLRSRPLVSMPNICFRVALAISVRQRVAVNTPGLEQQHTAICLQNEAMCAAHASLLEANADQIKRYFGSMPTREVDATRQPDGQLAALHMCAMAAGQAMAGAPLACATPALTDLLHWLLQKMVAAPGPLNLVTVSEITEYMPASPFFTATAVSQGTVALLLQAAQRGLQADRHDQSQQRMLRDRMLDQGVATALPIALQFMVVKLDAVAADEGGSGAEASPSVDSNRSSSSSGTSTAKELCRQVFMAVEQVKQALAQAASTLSGPEPGRLAALQQELAAGALLPAQQAAAQLLRLAEQEEGVKSLRALMARAAATRSCAYLRCANLAGEGGALAGEMKGGKRCSGCRVAWYCGTACSHADWKQGGHRKVCKLLAEQARAAAGAGGSSSGITSQA